MPLPTPEGPEMTIGRRSMSTVELAKIRRIISEAGIEVKHTRSHHKSTIECVDQKSVCVAKGWQTGCGFLELKRGKFTVVPKLVG